MKKKNERTVALHKSLCISSCLFPLFSSNLYPQFTLHPSPSIPLLSLLLPLSFVLYISLSHLFSSLAFSPVPCQQVLTWLCFIETKVLSAWPLGPISNWLVSQRLAEHASKRDMPSVCVCGREAEVTSFRNVSGGIYNCTFFYIFFFLAD